MKIDLYVMSGTGNTLRVARWCRDVAAELSDDPCEIHPISEGDRLEEGGEGMIGIMGPTHGFTAPWSVLRFAWDLPKGQGRPAFALFTRAGLKIGRWHPPGIAGSAALLVALFMALKGWRVRGVMSVNAPSNWVMVHPALTEEAYAAVRGHAQPKVEAAMRRLIGGERILWTLNNLYELLMGLTWAPISVLYLAYGRFWLAKLLLANTDCTGCGICAKGCPSAAIDMKAERPYWRFSCESCMRCVAYCPYKAIEVGHGWAALTYILWAIPVGWAGWRVWADQRPLISSVIEMVVGLGLLAVLYMAFHWSLKHRWVNRLFTLTSLTRFWGRAHDQEVKLSALMARRDRGKPTP